MGRSDEQLVEACLGGEVAAFDILVDRWQRKIRGAVYRVVRSEEEAQDICQEAFLKAFRGLDSFKRESRFSSWLYQIAINLSRDRLRRRKTRNWVSLDDVDEAVPAGIPPGSGRGASAWSRRWRSRSGWRARSRRCPTSRERP